MNYLKARGVCPDCGFTVVLRVDGTVRTHDPGRGGVSTSDTVLHCPGSGHRPE